ncbi:SDR family NAD(P)-dependent oxidoreductase [Mycobacterium hubeiense]|uniref:SDR family NAD(P)-dependent oxidoreductase n=1 Tax=Mycobacterium hubeiense TaxID=1867256 RepID=UPI00130436EA|nr:SDR family NAD(P)-dependent oxidoreductase [Mycobacterium sp. QGD 101]
MKSVVVTGTSSGIGRACALMLDRNGFRVFAGVRKGVDGESLRAAASEALTPVNIDVTDSESIHAMAEQVAREVGDAGLAGLVNNAGTTLPCPVECLPLDTFRHQLEVNLVGPLAVTQALLPLLLRGRGRIANVTSVAGRAAVPMMAPYVAAKHGLEGLSDVLRLELSDLGMHVAIVEPGFVSTEMRHKLERDTEDTIRSLPPTAASRYGPQLMALADSISSHAAQGSSPDVVAKSVLHALTSDKPRIRYPTGAGARRMLILRRILPDRQFDHVVRRAATRSARADN